MTDLTSIELEALSLNYQELVATSQTLMLSTASIDGIPDISYAPFVRSPDGKLTSHSINLLRNEHKIT
ncbi:MAG: pyridoxamine 5'-phosphate oxidase family protein [Methylococcales bacterium]